MLGVGGMTALTRVGFAARGTLYLLIGYLALRSGRTEDGAGAISYIGSGAGKPLLAFMGLGFLAYALWRLSEALIDSEGNGSDAKGAGVRAAGAMSGFIHVGLGLLALSIGLGNGGSSGGGGTREGAAKALSLPAGELILILAAAVLLLTGLAQLAKAWKADFLRHLDPSVARRDWVGWLGRAGYAARGTVFLLMGWFFWRGARDSDASEAGGMGEALSALPATLQTAVAAGLFLFGLFSFVEARHRRINDPHVLDRLKGAARGAL
jgi:hypothetical protein